MEKKYTIRELLWAALAAILLTVMIIAIYGWLLGPIFSVFVLTAWVLVELRIIR